MLALSGTRSASAAALTVTVCAVSQLLRVKASMVWLPAEPPSVSTVMSVLDGCATVTSTVPAGCVTSFTLKLLSPPSVIPMRAGLMRRPGVRLVTARLLMSAIGLRRRSSTTIGPKSEESLTFRVTVSPALTALDMLKILILGETSIALRTSDVSPIGG